MDTVSIIIIAIAVIILFAIFIKILKAPLKLAFKFLLNTLVGFIALIIINFFGAFIGISLGINWINAIVVGFFGIPGIALLFILQWLMII